MTAIEKANQWLTQNIDLKDKVEIRKLIEGPKELLEDAFHADLEFGTGGIRGIMGIGSNRVNKYTLGMATKGLSNYLKKSFPDAVLKVVIAHDCRNNSDSLTKLVADVFTANGIHVFLFPALRPTPELSFAVRELGCHSGIVITASHNPPEYNGYKVYWGDGAQIVAPHDKGIINEVRSIQSINNIQFEANETLLTVLDESMDNAFITASIKQRRIDKNLTLNIVFTSLHGTSITLMPELLKKAGYNDVHIVSEQAEPNGNFPTVKSPNPEEREALDLALKLAEKVGADMVVGTDPDSDRLGVAVRDSNGDLVLLNGNQCGVLITDYLLKKSNLKGNEFIGYTIVSSEMFQDVAKGHGAQAKVCLTGFKHIASLIRENEGKLNFIGGGEESYGYMVGDFVRDKDALTSTLIFCDLAAEAKAAGSSAFEQLCKLYEQHGFYFEHLVSITKKGLDGSKQISKMMDDFRSNPPKSLAGEIVIQMDDIAIGKSTNLNTGSVSDIDLPSSNVLQFFTEGGSKISVRPSGTEPKIKFYFSLKAAWNKDLSYYEQEKILKQHALRIAEDLGAI
jgi:phosphoglucomutase